MHINAHITSFLYKSELQLRQAIALQGTWKKEVIHSECSFQYHFPETTSCRGRSHHHQKEQGRGEKLLALCIQMCYQAEVIATF